MEKVWGPQGGLSFKKTHLVMSVLVSPELWSQPSYIWTAIDKLSIIWKSDLTDKMKRSFFKAAVVSILLYGCTIWTLTKRLKKKLDGNYTRMLQYWTSPGSNTPQSTNYTATNLPSRKLIKLDEPDMQDTAGEAGTSS